MFLLKSVNSSCQPNHDPTYEGEHQLSYCVTVQLLRTSTAEACAVPTLAALLVVSALHCAYFSFTAGGTPPVPNVNFINVNKLLEDTFLQALTNKAIRGARCTGQPKRKGDTDIRKYSPRAHNTTSTRPHGRPRITQPQDYTDYQALGPATQASLSSTH